VSVSAVRAVLDRHRLASLPALGQNFLVDPELASKLARRAGVGPDETVLEIGTGLGILTRALAERARRVVTLEVDAGLMRFLEGERVLPGNVALLHRDALRADLAGLLPAGEPARVVANLPYAIASPLLRRLLDLRERLRGWSVTVQREVAQRLAAGPGSRDYGSLAVLHHLTVRVEGGLDLHAQCFYPVPRVSSRFVNLRPLEEALLSPGELPWVERVVRAAFRHRRKTLVNSLVTCARTEAAGLPLPGSEGVQRVLLELGIDPRVRAEHLNPHQILDVARRLDGGPGARGGAHG
jgi:16S rRNA (adenine1518-N6/adenine1519-N6)-dimethyltransferase